jgi:hypothetical protein
MRQSYIALASGKATLDVNDQPRKPVDADLLMQVQGILLDEPNASVAYIPEKLE